MRIKICGITRVEDALLAAELGAHAVGFVFHPGSPRAVTPQAAARIAAALPAFISVVGLFVNASPANIREAAEVVPLDLLQFHGDEAPEACSGYGRRYIKAVRMAPGVDLVKCAAEFHQSAGLLLDAHVAGAWGGTGQRFDWARVPKGLAKPVILSGGLSPENVADGIRAVRPVAVDVSSGVESAPGIKDPEKLKAFIHEAQHADV
ncbi:MAG: phosphoribosylanthranilate isomerase [Burkholderiales bacterium]|nr:phosphoribosylanthranilate isomerase [Burkholderiales bacterium]